MRKRAPLFTAEELADMAISDHTVDVEENGYHHGIGEGYSKIVGGVFDGKVSRPTKS